MEIHLEAVTVVPVTAERSPLEPRGLPVSRASERSGFIGDDVPFGKDLEVQLTDAEGVRSRHEVAVARRLPDARAPDESDRRCEPRRDAVERDEVVEEIVRVIGRDPPCHWRPGDARSLATGDPELGLEVGSADDKREIDVQPACALDTLAAGSGVERPDGADVGALEEIVLDPHDGVVGVFSATGVRVEEAELPPPEPSVDPSPCDDRHGRAAGVEAHAARIEELHPARRA